MECSKLNITPSFIDFTIPFSVENKFQTPNSKIVSDNKKTSLNQRIILGFSDLPNEILNYIFKQIAEFEDPIRAFSTLGRLVKSTKLFRSFATIAGKLLMIIQKYLQLPFLLLFIILSLLPKLMM